MAETIKKAIVLSVYENEENLFVVSFFTQKGILNLVAQGLNKPTSKNRANLLIGSLVEIEYFASRFEGKMGRLKKASAIEVIDFSDQDNFKFIHTFTNLLKNINTPNHIFNICEKIYKYISPLSNNKILTFLFAQALIYMGICPNFNSCRICNNQAALIDFNINDGGFVCNRHGFETEKTMEYLQAVWCSFNNFNRYLIVVNNSLNKEIQRIYYDIIKENGYVL